jgi:lipoate-protein ligase A
MNFISARFIDVGLLEPAQFHASYAGIAEALEPDEAPVVMWGRSAPHISLGQSQDRSVELAAELEVPVVTRPLGGGAVWVDESQYCCVLVAPLRHAPPRPAEWFAWGLEPVRATYDHFGLPVERHGQDLWLAGRKIAGSGAATIGRCAVFASSFLLHFPAERFARCIASPFLPGEEPACNGFRDWLLTGLRQAMTDWASHQMPPAADALRHAFRAAVEQIMGWRLADSAPSAKEIAARTAALAELAEPWAPGGKRLVAGGVKLNAETFLYERRVGQSVELSLVRGGAVIRRFCRAA